MSLLLDARVGGGRVTRATLVEWLRSYDYFSRGGNALNNHREYRIGVVFVTIGNRPMCGLPGAKHKHPWAESSRRVQA